MNELKEIIVDEISVVDEGANPEAKILMFKRKQEDESMAKNETAAEVVNKQEQKAEEPTLFENLSKSLDEAITETVTKKENDELKARVAELEKKLAERDEAEKAAVEKAAKEKIEADNAALQEMFKRLNTRLEEHVEKAETAELMKVASKYEILGENADELVKAFKLAKTAGNYDTLIGLLDKSLAAVKKAGTFEEIGKSGYNSQAVSIEKYAREVQKAEPTLTWPQALDKAYQAHPELQD